MRALGFSLFWKRWLRITSPGMKGAKALSVNFCKIGTHASELIVATENQEKRRSPGNHRRFWGTLGWIWKKLLSLIKEQITCSRGREEGKPGRGRENIVFSAGAQPWHYQEALFLLYMLLEAWYGRILA